LIERWVVDASSVIILGKLSLIHLLTSLCDELIIPTAVAIEILRGPDSDNAKIWLKEGGFKFQKDIGIIDLKIASWDLGPGESEVISYCYANPQYIAIIDDRSGNKCAKTFSIKVKGTLAILVMAKEAKLIPKVKPIVDQMKARGFRIKSDLYNKIIELANE
jgi:predicted nucleic acid-binding protein